MHESNADPRNPPNEYHQARIADALERIANKLEEVTSYSYGYPAIRVRDQS